MFAGHIWRYDPRTRRATIYRSPSTHANGIASDLQGRMLVAEGADFGGRRATRTDLASGKGVIQTGLYNVNFGRGPDARTLFITAGQSLYRIRVQRTGFPPGQ